MPEPAAGYRSLPLSRRVRVRTLALVQSALDLDPRRARQVYELAPERLRHALSALAAPLRIGRLPVAELDVAGAATELEARGTISTEADSPRASLVVPTCGATDWLRLCLAAVAAHTEPETFEVVVVDDATPDRGAVSRVLANHPGVRSLRLEERRGFSGAVNRGVELARSDTLVILNDDAVVTPGWLSGLERALQSAPDVALVGPVSNDTGDRATVLARYASLAELCEHALCATGEPVVAEKLSLFCAMVRRSSFEAVGGLDEGYGAGMFEDDDLCMALRARGETVLLVPSVFVHHGAGVTLRRMSPLEYHARFEVNRHRFETRWGVRWHARG
jgi:GT2 family glycosyltransferase